MAEKAANRALDARETSPTPPARSIRGADGRFVVGHPGGPGRPRGQSISAELRRQMSAEEFASHVVALIRDPKTNARERLQGLGMFADRTEGKAIGRSIQIRSSASAILPPGFEGMTLEGRRAALLEIRSQAVNGELLLDGGDDDEADD